MNLEEKIEKVKEILRNKKVAIAFSGGADSSLMCYLASQVSKDTLAITIDNNVLPEGFIENTQEFCKKFNIKQEIIFEDFYKHEDIINNTPKRCYLCRKEMYKHIIKTAHENGFDTIVDGTNISDLVEDRPGILVSYENNIQSPFIEARLTSEDIHTFLDENSIPYSKSTTCLLTRVPFNEKLTKEKYDRISKSEKFIYENTNCKIVKVREKYPNCIVQVDNISEFNDVDKLNLIESELKANGYEEVSLKFPELQDYNELIVPSILTGFYYELPYEIDIEKTKIDDENIQINEDGTIMGKNFKTHQEAYDTFIEVLTKIRRLKNF